MNAEIWLRHPKLTLRHLRKRGKLPDLAHPHTLTEKYVWRLIFDRNPLFTVFCDKLATKRWIDAHVPGVRYADVLWTGDSIREAPKPLLRAAAYLKSNNSTNTNLKLSTNTLDEAGLHRLTQKWLEKDLYRLRGEWGYADITPVLFIEKDLATDADAETVEYSVYVFCGEISHVSVMTDHKSRDVRFARFREDGERMEIRRVLRKEYKLLAEDFHSPLAFDVLSRTAKAICEGIDHLRVDFLWNGEDLFLTEIVTYPVAGFVRYDDEALMNEMSGRWDLHESHFFKLEQTGWRKRARDWFEENWREDR